MIVFLFFFIFAISGMFAGMIIIAASVAAFPPLAPFAIYALYRIFRWFWRTSKGLIDGTLFVKKLPNSLDD